jgi:exopolysaccharide production protein ExoQ
MHPSLALIVFMVGIAGLFFLDRESSARTSKALWLPVIWIWIDGSRPISLWLGRPDSGLIDEIVAAILIVSGVIVIVHRGRDAIFLVTRSWPIAFYFSFSLVSVAWSDFPAHGFQRWIRALGDLVLAMIVATDTQPITALNRLFSRAGFVLLPMSVLLIKYYPELSRGYDPWNGLQVNTGVTTNKNLLGVMAFVITLGTFWQVLRLFLDKKHPNRGRHLLAQGTLLYFGLTTLFMAHSATSGASFILGAAFLLATALPVIRSRPAAVHAFVLAILLGGCLTVLLGGRGGATKALGRDENFTGRTEVWEVLLPMAPNPIFGAGFENFWFGPRLEFLSRRFGTINEAHDGYLEVYLNLGLLGVGLITMILVHGYWGAVGAFRRNSTLGGLLVAFVLAAAIYNITEAGFRMLSPIWFFLLLSAMTARNVIGVSTDAQDIVTAASNARTVKRLSGLPHEVASRRQLRTRSIKAD